MKNAILSFIAIILFATSCTKYVTIAFTAPPPDTIVTQSLKNYLKTKGEHPVILLRTPVSQLAAFSNPGDANVFYNTIEKGFLKKGYIVRDRAIFERVLTQSSSIDYSKMSELTNTDIIIEIVGFEKTKYYVHEVKTNKGKIKTYGDCSFGPYSGYKVDIKVVMVKDNSMGGQYVFDFIPQEVAEYEYTPESKYKANAKHCTLSPYGKKVKFMETGSYREGSNKLFEDLAIRISNTITTSIINGN